MAIEIKYLRKLDGFGKLVASFDVVINNAIQISKCKLIHGDKGYFVSMPSESYEKDGEKKYKNLVWISDAGLMKAITDAAVLAYGGSTPQQEKPEQPKWF